MQLRLRILLLFAVCYFHSTAQNYTYSIKQWDKQNGLSDRDVYTVLEDNQGLIWLGNSKGIQRYDGHEFKSWDKNNTRTELSDISKLGQDDANWLWMWNSSLHKFVFLNTKSLELKSQAERFGNDFPITSVKHGGTWIYNEKRIAKNRHNEMIFVLSQPNQLITFSTKRGFVRSTLPKLNGREISLKLVDDQDGLWVSEHVSKLKYILHHIDSNGKLIKSYDFKEAGRLASFTQSGNKIYFQLQTDRKTVQYHINVNGVLSRDYTLEDNNLKKVFNGTLKWEHKDSRWIVSDSSDIVIEIESKGYKKSLANPAHSIYEDSKQRVWITSYFGLSVIVPRKSPLTTYLSTENESAIGNSIRGITRNKDNLLVVVEHKGLVQLTPNRETKWISTKNKFSGLALEQLQGDSFLVTRGSNIILIDIVSKNIIQEVEFTKKEYPWCIKKTANDILVGTDHGLYSLSIDFSTLKPIQGVSDVVIYQIVPISKNTYLLATDDGVYIYNRKKNKIDKYNNLQTGKSFLPINTCYSALKYDSSYWLGTDEGIIQWNIETNNVKIYNSSNGLTDNTVYGVVNDDQKRLWLSTNFGLNILDLESEKVFSFFKKNGLPSNEFNRISHYKDENGLIYFGGINGLIKIDPRSIALNEAASNNELILTSFKIFDGRENGFYSRLSEWNNGSTIDVPVSSKYLQLKLALPTFEDDELNTYQWRFTDIDSTWQPVSGNLLQLGKLPYGEQLLEIRGANSGKTWSKKRLKIKLDVLKPFYLRAWFLTLLLVSFFGSILLYYNHKTNTFRKNEELLKLKIQEATETITKDKAIIEKNASELRRLDEIKTRFFTNVSHELRTPLTLIVSPLERIINEEGSSLSSKLKDLVDLSFNNSKKLKTRVDELLDLAKLDSSKLVLRNNPVNINKCFSNAILAFEPLAHERNVKIHISIKIDEDTMVSLDELKFVKVIDNLMSNAIKHTSNNSSIEASLSATKGRYVIRVSDGGPGVSVQEADNIFLRYYQSDTGEALGGSGIGLSYSKGLAELMGGDLILDQSYTKGASFIFSFRAASLAKNIVKVERSELSKNHFAKESATTTDKLRLLLVEDHLEMRQYIHSIIESNFEVLEATDGIEALKVIREHKVDIIISDIMMPNMDGITLLKELKKDEHNARIPFIFLSAKSDKSHVSSALEFGINDYIIKPFYARELLARINNVAQNLRVRQEHSSETVETGENQPKKEWLNTLNNYIKDHLSDTKFGVSQVVEQMAMSERSLNRKLNREIGYSCAAYIKELRLQEAYHLLHSSNDYSIKEVSVRVGFNRQDYLAKEFYKRFGKKPSEC